MPIKNPLYPSPLSVQQGDILEENAAVMIDRYSRTHAIRVTRFN
jgi:hypothetical protein